VSDVIAIVEFVVLDFIVVLGGFGGAGTTVAHWCR
jgi:hypothetical protein